MAAEAERPSAAYGDARHVDALFRAELPAAAGEVQQLEFDEAGLEAVRRHVLQQAAQVHLEPSRTADLAMAAAEAASNSVRHGGGRGELRTWQEDRALICEVRDDGRIADPMAGRRPPVNADGGRGLWLANQLCDLVQVRAYADGGAVRLHVRR